MSKRRRAVQSSSSEERPPNVDAPSLKKRWISKGVRRPGPSPQRNEAVDTDDELDLSMDLPPVKPTGRPSEREKRKKALLQLSERRLKKLDSASGSVRSKIVPSVLEDAASDSESSVQAPSRTKVKPKRAKSPSKVTMTRSSKRTSSNRARNPSRSHPSQEMENVEEVTSHEMSDTSSSESPSPRSAARDKRERDTLPGPSRLHRSVLSSTPKTSSPIKLVVVREQSCESFSPRGSSGSDSDELPSTIFSRTRQQLDDIGSATDASKVVSAGSEESRSIGSEGATTEDEFDLSIDSGPINSKQPNQREKRNEALAALSQRRLSRKLSLSSPLALEKARYAEAKPQSNLLSLEEGEEDEDEEMEEMEEDAAKSETSSNSESFIDDSQVDEEVHVVLPRFMRVKRPLIEEFNTFVYYVVASILRPSSKLLEEDKSEFDASHEAIREQVFNLSNKIAPPTWKPPFRCTLEKRPSLKTWRGGDMDPDKGCDACWQRGREGYLCTTDGVYTLSTEEGFYQSRLSFEVVTEENVQYMRETHFKDHPIYTNNALVPQIPYPPKFELVIGGRCERRAREFHKARHYCFTVFQIIEEELRSILDADEDEDELAALENTNAFIDILHERKVIDSLWKKLKHMIEAQNPDAPDDYADWA